MTTQIDSLRDSIARENDEMLSQPIATTVRVADHADVDRLVAMAQTFYAAKYRDRMPEDPAHLRHVAAQLLETGRVLVAEQAGQIVGLLAAALITHIIFNQRIAVEVLWWVEPAARGSGVGTSLVRDMETWATAQGAVKMQFAAYRDRGVEDLYGRLGYTPHEVIFEKELDDAIPSIRTGG